MRANLAAGGVLVEGTCDEIGRLGSWVLLDGDGPRSLTLAAKIETLARPAEFAERLPKALIHHNVPGTSIHRFLRDLDAAWDAAAPLSSFGPRQRWIAACRRSTTRSTHAGPARRGDLPGIRRADTVTDHACSKAERRPLRRSVAMPVSVNLAKGLDKAWEDKSLDEILAAPPSALAGLTEKHDAALADALGIKTIADLGATSTSRSQRRSSPSARSRGNPLSPGRAPLVRRRRRR